MARAAAATRSLLPPNAWPACQASANLWGLGVNTFRIGPRKRLKKMLGLMIEAGLRGFGLAERAG